MPNNVSTPTNNVSTPTQPSPLQGEGLDYPNLSPFKVRECNGAKADYTLLASIHAACFPTAWDEAAFADMLAVPGTEAWRIDDAAMLVVRMLYEQAEILTLAVMPEQRRQGLAAQLVAHAKAEAGRAGVKALFLEVADDNEAAIILYKKADFSIYNTRKGYYRSIDGHYKDALVMRCDLA